MYPAWVIYWPHFLQDRNQGGMWTTSLQWYACEEDQLKPSVLIHETGTPSLQTLVRYGRWTKAISFNYSHNTFTTNEFDYTGMVTANATTWSGDNPATDYHSTNDRSVLVGGNRSSQDDDQESEHDLRDFRENPGSQSMSCPQSNEQHCQRAEPRAGSVDQSDDQPTRETASMHKLERLEQRLNTALEHHQVMQPSVPMRAQVIAETHMSNRRPTNSQTRCKKNTKASIKIVALNIQGMGNTSTWHPNNKWNHVNQIMNTKRIGILIVGEAHLNDEWWDAIESMPRSRLQVLHSEDPKSLNARGVAIVLNKEITETENVNAVEIVPGCALLLETCWHGMKRLSILGIYVPVNPVQNTRFWSNIKKFFEDNPNIRKPDVMAEDMNVTEDPIDRFPAHPDYTSAVDSLDETRTMLQLIDGWRNCYLTMLKYTWWHLATGTQSQLDRIYIKNGINKHCYEWAIKKSGVPTDHDMVFMRFLTATAPTIRQGRWVMPLHIVKDSHVKEFLLKVGCALQDEVEKYL